jgi:hypothetical protein
MSGHRYRLLTPKAEEKKTPYVPSPWHAELGNLKLVLQKLAFIEHFYAEKTNTVKYGQDGKYSSANKHARLEIRALCEHIRDEIAVPKAALDAEAKPSHSKFQPSPNLRHPDQIIEHIKKILLAAVLKIKLTADHSVNHPDALLRKTIGYALDHIDNQPPGKLGFFTRATGKYNEYISFYEKNKDKLLVGSPPLQVAEAQVKNVMSDHLLLLKKPLPLPTAPKTSPVSLLQEDKSTLLPPPPPPVLEIKATPPKLKKTVSFGPLPKKIVTEKPKSMLPPGLTAIQAYALRRREMERRLRPDLPKLSVDAKKDIWQEMHAQKSKTPRH